jgi:transposase
LRLTSLSDVEWAAIRKLIPNSRIPGSNLRSTVDGILWRMRTGGSWHTVPKEYGNWSSIRNRFQEWSSSGAWHAIAATLAEVRATSRYSQPGKTELSDMRCPGAPLGLSAHMDIPGQWRK